MKITPTKLPGVFVIESNSFQDERGVFVKVFHEETFKENNLDSDFKESFYSISNKDVVRGMHFHLPPNAHSKLVYVTNGSVLDVVLDLRKDSPTYGSYHSIELSQKNHTMMYIPVGCAHGFLSLEDNSCTVYLQTGMYSPSHDSGINVHSFGMKWPANKLIVSKRDQDLINLQDFDSPFSYTYENTY